MYEKEWSSNFKDLRSLKMSLVKTLKIMLKQNLIEKPQRAHYQLTEKGTEFYKTNVEKMIKITKRNLRNLIFVM